MQPTTAWMGPPSDPGRVMTTRVVWEGWGGRASQRGRFCKGSSQPCTRSSPAANASAPAPTANRAGAPADLSGRPTPAAALRSATPARRRPALLAQQAAVRAPRGPEAHRPGSSSPPTCWPRRRSANSSTAATRTVSRPAPRSSRRRTSAPWRSWRPQGCMALRCGGRSARSRRMGRM
jgi:hypothetical protein